MITGYLHGHKIIFDGVDWKYFDTGISIENEPRPCKRCGKTSKKYDSCLGKLPGVKNACCGHGVEKGYIQFDNGVIVRGYFEIEKEKP